MDYESEGCLHEIFERQMKKTSPTATAVVSGDGRSISFGELNNLSDVLATNLRNKGVKRDKAVGIYLERSLEYPVAYVAILKAGGAYMPLELSYPENLLNSILEDAQPAAVITSEHLKDKLPKSANTVILSDGWEERLSKENERGLVLGKVKSELDDLAYIVYSSGTTGKPKGICCPHRGAVFSYTWRFKSYPFQPDDRVACNVFFVWEMLRPLLKGIPLYVIPDSVIYDPTLLLPFMKKHKITQVLFTPSLLETILTCENSDLAGHLSSMRTIWLCGEVVTTALRDRCMKILPWIKLLNLYSVSECHDVASANLTNMQFQEELSDSDENKRKFCPVGKLLPGVYVAIMDDNLKPLPVGLSGEIFVGGPTLARGYLNRPELNAFRFIDCPKEVPESAGPKLYRTGDWGYLLSSGMLEICGRCDSMVKVRGYSIETQAVEAALLQLPMVSACCVVAHGEEGDDKYLAAYIVPEGNKVTKKDVRAALKTRLPFYMIPSHFVFLASIPVTPAGKLDKKKLPPITSFGKDEEGLPSTSTERSLAQLWCEVLNIPNIDVQEGFFDLGGHSLLATHLLLKVNSSFRVNLTVQDLFASPTVAEMAKMIDELQQNGSQMNKDLYEGKVDLPNEVNYHSGAEGFVKNSHMSNITFSLLIFQVHVFCVVREQPEGLSGKDRLKQILQKFKVLPLTTDRQQMTEEERYLDYGFEHRVTVVKGDVSLIKLGMSEEEFVHLSSEVHVFCVVREQPEGLSGKDRLKQILQKFKVLPLTTDRQQMTEEERYLDYGFEHRVTVVKGDVSLIKLGMSEEEFVHLSSESPFVILQRKRDRGIIAPLTLTAENRVILDCISGNLSADREHVQWNPLDFTLLMIKGMTATLSAPDIDWQVEMTPVDFVSEIIVKMTQEMSISMGKIFHIINPQPISAKWLFEWMSVHGYPLDVIPFQDWCRRIEVACKNESSNGLSSLLRLLEMWLKEPSFLGSLSTYTMTNFEAVMKHFKVSYPLLNSELLTTYFSALVAQGVLPTPKKKIRGPRSLGGKVAIVTGASSGIGEAVARALAENGAKVVLAARRKDRLDKIRDEIAEMGDVAVSVATDVVNRQEVLDLVAHTKKTLGPVDIIVNCAGLGYYTTLKNCLLDEWERMVDVNCKGVMNSIAAVLPGMLTRKKGHIISISSNAGRKVSVSGNHESSHFRYQWLRNMAIRAYSCCCDFQGVMNSIAAVLPGMLTRKKGHIISISSNAGRKVFAGLTVYSATKFFVEALMQGLRLETVGSGIKVTTIQPGDVVTEFVAG
ncbi:PREDICTED: linear gramicidin synthase subunit D-like [Acropora digitifera]|uniref:linear gramicidin synthase subunit D-like n=1 Tax=Acropora digitifera TaxID=70779 RepID=UPI00077A6F53|nr:PREDICTED: linear gramicidin synthase subunit D-like [Acropora digitifera]